MNKNTNNLIILVDGSFYIHRAYHAYPPLTTTTGKPIWIIYGVINMLKRLLIQYQPTHMAIILDSGGITFRHKLFPQYKSNRPKLPKDFYDQINPLCQVIKTMGIPIFSIPNIEADDIIGTLATLYAKIGKKILISTGDKDITQIVSPKITLINTISNIIITSQEVEKKFGVPPTLIPDYLALTGDQSDNIPGVPGIGKKTAPILLTKIGNLDTLYKNLNKIDIIKLRRSIFIKNTLTIHKTTAYLSYKLATINTNVPLNISDNQLIIQPTNITNLLTVLKEYELKKWIKDIELKKWLKTYHLKYQNILSPYKSSKDINKNYTKNIIKPYCINMQKNTTNIVNNVNILQNWINKIYIYNHFAFDIYTDTSNALTANIINISLAISKKENIHIPTHNIIRDNLSIEETLFILKPILENPNIKKIGNNLKFIYTIFKRHNINLAGTKFDIMIALYILYGTINYQNIKNILDKNITNNFLKFIQIYNNYHFTNLIPKLHDIKLQSSHSEELLNSIFDMYSVLWPKIQENNKSKKIFEEIEIPLIPVLSRIESYGVLIDKTLLNTYSIELNSRLNKLKKHAHQLTNTPFNLNSTKQLQKILYEKQKLPILKKTKKGSPSTNEEVLKKLSKNYIIPKIILQYRKLSKLKSTYTNTLTNMINVQSNRIHTSYNQTRTATGRLSSTNPNLQNIPNRNRDGRKIRQAFISPKNFLIVSADYSQIELRIMAHLSHDNKLINDFISEKDIHAITASEIFLTKLHLVTTEQRHQAKTINFGLIYGMTAFGLARQLSVTCKEAQKYVNRYFKRYPGIMEYIKNTRNDALKYGYVYTLNGRKLYLPNIHSSNISQKKSAERAAINAPMQGSAADIIKKAMISIDNWLQTDKIPAKIIMQVHDELVFEVKSNIIDLFIKKIKKLMEESLILTVPLKVDIGIGKNWEQAH